MEAKITRLTDSYTENDLFRSEGLFCNYISDLVISLIKYLSWQIQEYLGQLSTTPGDWVWGVEYFELDLLRWWPDLFPERKMILIIFDIDLIILEVFFLLFPFPSEVWPGGASQQNMKLLAIKRKGKRLVSFRGVRCLYSRVRTQHQRKGEAAGIRRAGRGSGHHQRGQQPAWRNKYAVNVSLLWTLQRSSINLSPHSLAFRPH